MTTPTVRSREGWARRLASQVYDAYADDRRLRDVPLWLTAVIAGVAVVLALLGGSPWRWLLLPVVMLLLVAPVAARWALAIWRALGAFRDGLQGR